MNKFLVVTALLSVVFGILGFYVDLGYEGFFRISFLIVADIFVILLIGKLIFTGKKVVKKYKTNRINRTVSHPTVKSV
jgi:hypothetical protein